MSGPPGPRPRGVVAKRNLLIPLEDGSELAADLYLPDTPPPHPVLISYYPYHKDDVVGAAYEHANRYFAEHGYGSLLIDFRGLGSSSGVAQPAMDAGEAEDGAAIVAWAARQEWCNGNVGMWGLSYGGITALRTAAARPPALRAIVPMMATDDIYHHWFYPGGCPNMMGVYGVWGPMMLAFQLMPPMFHDTERRWQEVWDARLENTRPYILDWPEHPDFDDYWQSKVIDSAAIDVPTYLIGGWRDIFPEAMVTAYGAITAPTQLLMGPWLHTQPDQSPFEAIEHLPSMLAWWDRWLGNGDPPKAAPVTFYCQGAGWRQSNTWPPLGHTTTSYFLTGNGDLHPAPDARESSVTYTADPSVGASSTLFDPLGQGIGLPLEQSSDDAASATFTSEPLADGLLIVGSAEAKLDISLATGAEAHVVAKLCVVAPDGRSRLITTGWLRTRASGVLRVRLWATAYHLPRGHRIRLSVACSDFPRIWPTATNPTITIRCGGEGASSLAMPTIDPEFLDHAEMEPPRLHIDRAPLNLDFEPRWRVVRDPAQGTLSVETGIRSVLTTPSGDGRVEIDHLGTATLDPQRPGDATVVARTTVTAATPSGPVVVVESGSHATRTSLALHGEVTVDGIRYFDRSWKR